ncbi:lipopolysaccharide biosynthesis protein [Hungatella hathewayi]
MTNTRTGNSIKNSGATIFGRIATLAMEFVLRTVLIKTLGIQYGGISSLFTDILQVLSLMELGLGSAIIFALYRPLAEKNYTKINALMHFYKRAYNFIAIGVFLLGMCCIPFLKYIVSNVPDIKEDIRIIFMLYVAASSCSYLVVYKETLIRASQLSRIAVWIEMMVQIVFMTLESIALFIFHEYRIYLVLRIVTYLVRNMLISHEVKKLFPEVNFSGEEHLDHNDRQKLMKDIGAMALYKISGVVLNGTDSIIISAFLGTSIVGIMGNFRMLSNFVTSLSNKIWVAVLPSVGNMAAVVDDNKQYRVFLRVNLGSFIFASFCSVAMFNLMNPLVSVWLGAEYTVSTITTFAISFNMYLFLTILPFQTFRDANGLFVQGKYRPVIMSVINIVLSLILVRPCGMFGVLIATPISRFVTQTWFDPYIVYKNVFRRSPLPYYKEFAMHFFITLLNGALTWSLLELCHLGGGLLRLVIGVIMCAILPLLIYYILLNKNQQFNQLIGYFKCLLKQILKRKEEQICK